MNEFENYLTEYELSEWASADPYGFSMAYASSRGQQPAPENAEDWLTVDNVLDVLGLIAGAGIFLRSGGRIRPNFPFGMNPPRQLP